VVGRRGEVGRRRENFGAEKRWKKKKHAGNEDGIFVHPQNGFNRLILNWCIGGCWFIPALYIIPTTIVQLEIILKGLAQKEKKFYRYLLKLLRIKLSTHQNFLYCPNHWVIIRN